jgi:hypothetical protein
MQKKKKPKLKNDSLISIVKIFDNQLIREIIKEVILEVIKQLLG